MNANKRIILNLLVAIAVVGGLVAITSKPARAEVSITYLGTPYTQNFDSLANSGTSATWTNDSTLLGWYLSTDATPSVTSYLVGTGSGTTGGFYSFGDSSSPERALGGMGSNTYYGASGVGKGYIGLVLQNQTGATINALSISYTGEQWRNGGNTAVQSLTFSYVINSSIPNLTDEGTAVPALDFASPIHTSTSGVLDGNAAANRTALSSVITGFDIPNNYYILLRWTDLNDSGSDHALAIDDLSVTANGAQVDAAPSVLSTVPANGAVNVPLNSNITINFSEPVNVAGAWFSLSCANSGVHSAAVSGGPTSFVLDPDADFDANELCTITVVAGQITDQGTNDPPDNMAADYPWSFTIIAPSDPTGTGAANPNSVAPGDTTLLTVAVTPGANPTSTGLAVTGNLADIGGANPQTFYDDGAHGDVTTGDNIFSFQATVTVGTADGSKSIPATITDGQGRSGSATIVLTVQATPPAGGDVVISQIYGGGGNAGAFYKNDFIELYNRTANSIDLTGWSIQYTSAAGATWNITQLSGSIAPGKYYLVQEAAGASGTVNLPTPDAIGTATMSATAGKVALVRNITALSSTCPTGNSIADFVGYGNTTGSMANCYEGAGAVSTLNATTAAMRRGYGATDTNNNSADFTTGTPAPHNSSWVSAAPAIASTVPANGATGVALDATIVVAFTEPVNATGDWATLSCASSGAHIAMFSGGPQTFILTPTANFVNNENCTVTVVGAQVNDLDPYDPQNTLAADYTWSFTTVAPVCSLPFTPTYQIQGSGLTTPYNGATVTTQGVVVGDYEGASPALRGFYLQDSTGDSDPATSDGIFVFESNNANSVNLGDVVRVTGTAGENQGQTQVSANSIVNCNTTATVTPVDVNLPFANANDPERFEGMLVRLPQTLYVTEHYQLGRSGEVLLSSARLQQPTNVVAPGAPALALQAANDLDQILMDDASQVQNPNPIVFGRGGDPLSAGNTLRGGDTVSGIVGVMGYTWGGYAASPNAYRVRPINALGGYIPSFAPANPRPAVAPNVGGSVRVVGMNLLNFFNTFDGDSTNPPYACNLGVGGDLTDCRGADDAAEFARQWPKTVAAIIGMDADVIGLVELENDGYGPDSAIAFLVDQLNAATTLGTYAFIDVDAATAQVNALGTDAIKVGLISPAAPPPPACARSCPSVAPHWPASTLPSAPPRAVPVRRAPAAAPLPTLPEKSCAR